jgi:Ca2+-binding RTX toxin-like protein
VISGSTLQAQLTEGGPLVNIGTVVGSGSEEGSGNESGQVTTTLDPAGDVTFDFLYITPTDGSLKIYSMSFEAGAVTDDVTANFTATATDGDTDVATDTFEVTFSGGSSGNFTLTGTSGDDALHGGTGNDILTGGAGSDTFQFTGTLTADNADTITDFNVAPVASGGDVLNLHDVLQGTLAQNSADPGTLGAHINVQTVGSNTVISIDADGGGSAAPVQVVTLEGVSGVTLAQLLQNNQIIT